MLKPIMGVALAALMLAACGQKTETENVDGPAVSASQEPRNEAVDTTPNSGEAGPTPGANSYTADQARAALEKAGYTDISVLNQNENGLWQAAAVKDGKSVNVSIDYKGAVTAR
ncbi:hypothetical protein ABOZ73_07490 [Caulobacter sp. 73W]|uniref:PepSY domain-containing protein n=1 Tax=Caulobacter sp. 73W TaxID=3161137 RepID=A0AB39KX79_9CAUL